MICHLLKGKRAGKSFVCTCIWIYVSRGNTGTLCRVDIGGYLCAASAAPFSLRGSTKFFKFLVREKRQRQERTEKAYYTTIIDILIVCIVTVIIITMYLEKR